MPIRVLHTPENTAGNPQGLAEAERELGLASRVVSLHPGPFGVATDEVLWADDPPRWRAEARRVGLLVRACRDFDVVHFNFGLTVAPTAPAADAAPPPGTHPLLWRAWRLYSGLLDQRDLPLLRRLGKVIVVTFQGDDARQGDRLASLDPTPATEVEGGYYTCASDERKRRRIAGFARHADQLYAVNPDLLHVLPPGSGFLPYASVDPRRWKPVAPGGGPPLVVHAPSHRGVKGTRFVLEAVERLRASGVEFEFALVEGMDRTEARQLYERADVLVDQLLIGWYGAVAVEAMALGKAVVCFVRDEDLAFVPAGMRDQLPVVRATPGDVYEVLHRLLTGPREHFAELGRRGREYVERWHDPLRVAAETKAAYEGALERRRRR